MTSKKETTNTANVPETVSPMGYKFVTRTAFGAEEVTSEPIKVPNFQGPVGSVTVSAHFTKNLGNYESARVGVEISLPCYASDEEVLRTADHITELCTELLSEQITGLGS